MVTVAGVKMKPKRGGLVGVVGEGVVPPLRVCRHRLVVWGRSW